MLFSAILLFQLGLYFAFYKDMKPAQPELANRMAGKSMPEILASFASQQS